MTKSNNKVLDCIDLFAGCGGLSLGLKEAGWSGIFAIERDPMAFETLTKNLLNADSPYSTFKSWPEWLEKKNHDLVKLLETPAARKNLRAMRGTVTLMAGGPPCQGFSVGGRRDGTDERNNMVFHMLDMVELVRPRMVLIENVEGITRKFVARPGEESTSVADAVIERLSGLGYTGTFHVLDSSDFGVPQVRRRVAILGLLNSPIDSQVLKARFVTALQNSASEVRKRWGLHPTNDTTAKEAIQDLHGGAKVTCPDSKEFTSGSYTKAISAYAKALRKGAKTNAVPDSHRFSKHGERVQTLYKLAHETQTPGRLSKSFLMENNTKKDKKVLIDPASPVSTITTHPDEFIHYAEPRNVTVREMARLQSFPDDFHFHGRYTINGPRRKLDVARCSQVGNAVPPLMAQGIGLAVRALLLSLETEAVVSSTPKVKMVPRKRQETIYASV
jgi:DNA (cytosine-5)-methyltransferase 1